MSETVNEITPTNKVISDFIFNIKSISHKIEDNTATIDDYSKLEKMLEAIGLPKDYFSEPLKKNGFSGWADYYTRRQKSDQKDIIVVKGIIGSIIGVSSAAVEFLNKVEKE